MTNEIADSFIKGKKIIESNGRTENPDGSFSLEIRISLDGIIYRIINAKRIGDVREYNFALADLLKNYDLAKKAFIAGDLETVGKFFMLYVGVEK